MQGARASEEKEPFLPWTGLLWLALTPPLLALLFEPQGSSNPLDRQLGTLAAIWLYAAVVGLCLHLAMNPAARTLMGDRIPRGLGVLGLVLVAVAVVSALTPPLLQVMKLLCTGVAGHGIEIYVRGLLVTLLYVLAVRGVVVFRRHARLERERALVERKAAIEARWQALQARTHPHFLFNTLNTAMSLVHSDPDLAERTLERLASLLRYALEGSQARRVPLTEEIDAVREYLEIEQTRFGERLSFEIDRDGDAERALVPPMLVQPLVENAVLHGLAGRIEGGHVWVRARTEGSKLLVTVEDDGVGPGGSARKGTGSGMSGARERLELAYEREASLSTAEREGGGFCATIALPLERRAPHAARAVTP